MFSKFFLIEKPFIVACLSISLLAGCAVEAAKEKKGGATGNNLTETPITLNGTKSSSVKTSIKIEPNSPADTVRVFYKHLREGKFRDALFLTNIRPAIEGLTDAELKELQVDFAPLAAQIPAEIEINGEIVSKTDATVTAKLPDNETDELKIQEIRLRRVNNFWMILTVDAAAEAEIKQEGRNYFTHLKIKTHQEEAKEMLERVNKAQMVYSAQNNGLYGDAAALIEKNYLPKDFLTAETTGYNYKIELSADRKKFTASAVPAVYGKTGKLTYWFETSGNKTSALMNKDAKGQASKM